MSIRLACRHIPVLCIALLLCASCASQHTLAVRPDSSEIARINRAAEDRWVEVVTTDRTSYEGNHFSMSDSDLHILTGGSPFFNRDGDADVTIPIDAVASISIEHLNAFKPLAYPVLGFILGAAAYGALGAEDSNVFLVCGAVGTGLGALAGVGSFFFSTLPDLFTDRPTYYLKYSRPILPIVVVDSTSN